MISLQIGNEERRNDNIEERWIAQQLRKRNGQLVCIKLVIREGDVNVPLSSGACANMGSDGGGRKPNNKELQVLKLWDQKGLNGEEINPGMLISFLNQYEKYL